MEIPIELIEQIEEGNCVLFLGWAESEQDELSASHTLSKRVLAHRLAERVHYPHGVGPLVEVAEYFEDERGRHALVQYVCDVIEEYSDRPPGYYRAVMDISFNIIVSTSLDNFLQKLLQERKKPFVSVVREEEIPFSASVREKLLLVKLYGDIDNKSSMVITREDYVAFFDRLPSMSDLLKYYFSSKTLLFIGYDLNSFHFLQLYAYANQRTKGYQRRAYAIKQSPSSYETRHWRRRNLEILDFSPEDFLEKLPDSVRSARLPPKDPIADRASNRRKRVRTIDKPPYKFLNFYEEQDEDIFFGRDDDIVEAYHKLVSWKLMILWGKSGFGKTSLLRAGLTPLLIDQNYWPVYTRCGIDPLRSIKINMIDRVRKFNGPSAEQSLAHLESAISLPLADFLREFKKVEKRPLVVFVDQFEEFFISLGDATRKQFEMELAECVYAPYFDATFLLCLREDFVPRLHELRGLPDIYKNRYPLKALTNEAAEQAITEPARKCGITFGAGLVDLIVSELSEEGQVGPAQLQIVCDRLYKSLPDTEARITMDLYEELGGVQRILSDYVDSTLYEFGPNRGGIARQLLRHMVTSLYTRIPLRYSDAVLYTQDVPDWSADDVRKLLRDLVEARLIRRVADAEQESYELTHEQLINKIREWIDLETLRVKEAEDVLRRAYNNWKRHRIAMDRSALQIIDAQRELLKLNKEQNAFILAAAVSHDFEFLYWLERNQRNPQTLDLLTWLLQKGDSSAKRLAGVALGNLTDDQDILNEIYSIYESVANPNTAKRIEELRSRGVRFTKGFLGRVCQVVEHRFTKNIMQ